MISNFSPKSYQQRDRHGGHRACAAPQRPRQHGRQIRERCEVPPAERWQRPARKLPRQDLRGAVTRREIADLRRRPSQRAAEEDEAEIVTLLGLARRTAKSEKHSDFT